MHKGSSSSKPDESSTGRHIPALDGLRGLAILLVLACHLLASNPYASGSWPVRLFARLHDAGWVGVDLFFVLSGFLITGILYDTLSDRYFFRNFYARRALRIFPLYYGFLLLLLGISCFTHNHWYRGTWMVLTYTVNLPITGVLVTDAGWLNINHVWSLAIEEQFYLFWPLLVYLLRDRHRIAFAACCGIGFSLLVRVACVAFTSMPAHPYVVYSWTPARLDGLFSGALVAMLLRSHPERLLRAGPGVLATGLAGLAAIFVHEGVLEWAGRPFLSAVLPLLLAWTFSGLLICSLRARSVVQGVFSRAPWRFFGRYSYGLYLFHYTLAACIAVPLRRTLAEHGMSKLVSVTVPAALVLALSVVAAWLSFRYFELPFLRFKDHFTNRSRHPRLGDLATPSGIDPAVVAAE